MEPTIFRRYWGAWICAGGLIIGLLGCEPLIYQAPPLPPPLPSPLPPPYMARPTLYTTVNRLNLRACPGMDCPKISVLELNEEVEKVGESEDWTQIRVKRDGRLGWVTSRFLSPSPAGPAPEVAPGPQLPPLPEEIQPPPLPEKPPVGEKVKPPKPGEVAPPKKKPEEGKPPKAVKGPPAAEEEETQPRKPAPVQEKPAPPAEKPAPAPAPPPEGGQKPIRIM